MGKRKRKRNAKGAEPMQQHRGGVGRDHWAALLLATDLQHKGKEARALFVELEGQHYVVMVRRAEVIITDPASQN